MTSARSGATQSRPHQPKPLAGLRIVVCRPRHQARSLVDRLLAAGAVVLSAPVIAITEPADSGDALRDALRRLATGDWLVFTSPNGAAAVAAAMTGEPMQHGAAAEPEVAATAAPDRAAESEVAARADLDGINIAAIGPGTARRAEELGMEVHLVAQRSVAEGLLEAFPAPGGDGGLVVLARAATARQVLPDGLRAAGWEVLDVAAYRNIAVRLSHEQMREACTGDGVVFTSSSTVKRLVEELGAESVPPLVASIGPATSATAAELGLEVTVEASEHTIDGVVAALIDHADTWTSTES